MIAIVIVWIAGIICVFHMKKIEPEVYKFYAVYVLAIEVMFTTFVVKYLSNQPIH